MLGLMDDGQGWWGVGFDGVLSLFHCWLRGYGRVFFFSDHLLIFLFVFARGMYRYVCAFQSIMILLLLSYALVRISGSLRRELSVGLRMSTNLSIVLTR